MIRIKHKVLLVVLFFSFALFGSDLPPKYRHKKSGNGVRINFGPSLNFYTINEKHGVNPKQKSSGVVGFRREIRVVKDYKTYILIGLDYMFHGLNYQSYYFRHDSLKLYDKKFNYNYSVFLHEIQLPIQLKYLMRREDNSPFSPYFLLGYHLRYLLPANVKVTEEGRLLKDDNPELKFKNYLLGNRVNASVSASLGWQRNNLSDFRGSFFGEVNFQYGFSEYYFETDYSAASMFMSATHVTLLLGIKF